MYTYNKYKYKNNVTAQRQTDNELFVFKNLNFFFFTVTCLRLRDKQHFSGTFSQHKQKKQHDFFYFPAASVSG